MYLNNQKKQKLREFFRQLIIKQTIPSNYAELNQNIPQFARLFQQLRIFIVQHGNETGQWVEDEDQPENVEPFNQNEIPNEQQNYVIQEDVQGGGQMVPLQQIEHTRMAIGNIVEPQTEDSLKVYECYVQQVGL